MTVIMSGTWNCTHPKTGGRPRSYPFREIVNGILYLTKTGCQWRILYVASLLYRLTDELLNALLPSLETPDGFPWIISDRGIHQNYRDTLSLHGIY